MTASVGITVEKSPYPVSPELARLISSANGGPATAARCFLQWTDRTNPSRGVFSFDEIDANVKAFTEAKLPFYISSYCAPAWASGGIGWYEGYSTPCSHANQPWTGAVHAAEGDPNGQCTFINPNIFGIPGKRCTQRGRPNQCDNAPDIDYTAVREWHYALANRYPMNPYLLGIGSWNEPGIRTYWWGRPGEESRDKFRRLARQVLIPARAGARDHGNLVGVVGPEADSPGLLGDLLQFEAEFNLSLFDTALTIHYPTPEQYEREYRSAIGNNLKGREVWISEAAVPAGMTATDYLQSWERFREITRVFLHPLDLLFRDGSLKDGSPEPRDASKGLEPSPLFHELAEYTARQRPPSRRRGVGK